MCSAVQSIVYNTFGPAEGILCSSLDAQGLLLQSEAVLFTLGFCLCVRGVQDVAVAVRQCDSHCVVTGLEWTACGSV